MRSGENASFSAPFALERSALRTLWDGNSGFDAAKHTWYCAGLMHSYAAASDAFLPALTTKPENLVNGAGLRAETGAWWSSGVRQWGKG
jgi:hypothetical protein